MTSDTATIFALSSGAPPAAIAVIRISGPAALDAASALTTRALPEPRKAALRRFVDPAGGEVIDEGLLLTFPGPATETGEDMVELHCHGSLAVVRGIEDVLGRLPGLRLAHPGEFTRRAFLNGRIDISTIEGLGDLLAAETAVQRRAAMVMMGGALSRRVAGWTDGLRRLSAQVEAQLDFSDEGDVGATLTHSVAEQCAAIARDMRSDLAKPSTDRLKDGVRVTIGGPPNAGKSTLFNALVGRDAAIVSAQAGTTRDIIEAPVAIRGIPFVLSDTAGLRQSDDLVEQIGVDRAGALIRRTDILLWLGEAGGAPEGAGMVIEISAKADLGTTRSEGLTVSAFTGQGMDALVDNLCDAAQVWLPVPGDYGLSRRQREVLERASAHVEDAGETEDEILIAESLRLALSALDELTGRHTTEAMLDELFAGFCIGK